MNSFFKTNGPQVNIMKDIMDNFDNSFLTENLRNEENSFDILRKNINSLENNTVDEPKQKKQA